MSHQRVPLGLWRGATRREWCISLPRGATRPQAKGDAPIGSERSAPLRRCSGNTPIPCGLRLALARSVRSDATLLVWHDTVPCHTRNVASARPPWSVARRDPQGMVHFIAKGCNAATGEGGRAHRERTECATAALQALAIRRVFPAGCALHRRAPFALMRHYSCGTTQCRVTRGTSHQRVPLGLWRGATRREWCISLPRGATRPQAKGDAPIGSERSAPLRRCRPWQYAGYSLRAAPCIGALRSL